MHLIYACRIHLLHCTYMPDRVFRTRSVIFGDPNAFYEGFIISADSLRSPDGSLVTTGRSGTRQTAAAAASAARSSHSHGGRHQAASLLAREPACVVRTDRGTVLYQEHHEPKDAVRVRGRSLLQRVRRGDPRSDPQSTTGRFLYEAQGPLNQTDCCFGEETAPTPIYCR